MNNEIALNMCSLEKLTSRRDKPREKLIDEWTHPGKTNIYTIDIPVIDPSQLSNITECPGNLSRVFGLICDKRITYHYRDYIISQRIMLECYKSSVYTKSEQCYKLFCCMNIFNH